MKKSCIFLDNNSSTEVDPRVLDKFVSTSKLSKGNSSSKHFFGWQSHALYELAKENIAQIFGTSPECVVFTSGATEANNIVLLGLKEKSSYLSSNIEHSSVYECLNRLSQDSLQVSILEIDSEGRTVKDQSIIDKSNLISLHHANNEIGVIEDFTDFDKPKDSILHTDASQSIGKIPISFDSQAVDIITLSGHKIHAPKGIGALIFRSLEIKKKFSPILFGGHHHEDLRPGTIPVALCFALSEAISIATKDIGTTSNQLSQKAEMFYQSLKENIPNLKLIGPQLFANRLPGLLSLSFPLVLSSKLIANLASRVAFSSGSACRVSQSRVVSELSKDQAIIDGFARFGISKFTTENELETASRYIIDEYNKLKG